MNNEIPPKPLAKALSVEMKNVCTVRLESGKVRGEMQQSGETTQCLAAEINKIVKWFCFNQC